MLMQSNLKKYSTVSLISISKPKLIKKKSIDPHKTTAKKYNYDKHGDVPECLTINYLRPLINKKIAGNCTQ